MTGSSGHDPGSGPHLQREALSFGLSLVERQAVVTLGRPRAAGPLQVDHLEMGIPEIQFPFDLSGGANRFRHRRCLLQRAVLSCHEVAAQEWLATRLVGQELVLDELELSFGEGTFDLTGWVRSGERAAPFVFSGLVEPSGEGRRVCISICEATLYDDLPLPAPAVAARLLLAAAGDSTGVELIGCSAMVLDPLELALMWTLPPGGWRLPSLSRCRLTRLSLTPGQIMLRYGATEMEEADEEERQLHERWDVLSAKRRELERHRTAEEQIPGDLDQAIAIFRQALTEEPDDLFAMERLLQLLCAIGPTAEEELLKTAEQAIARQPGFLPALTAEAAVHVRHQDWAAAASCYRRAADSSRDRNDLPGEVFAIRAAARCAVKTSLSEARLDYERLLQIDQGDERVLAALAKVYADTGAWKELASIRRLQLTMEPNAEVRLHTHLALGELYRVHLSDNSGAREQYELALVFDPTCEPALRGLAAACIEEEELELAVQTLDTLCQIVARRGDSAAEVEIQLRIASLLQHLNDPAGAARRLQRAVLIRPGDASTLLRTADLMETMGRAREAAELLDKLLQGQLTDELTRAKIHRRLGGLLLALEELPAAQRQIDRALELRPDDPATLELALALADRSDNPDRLADILGRAAAVEKDRGRRSELLFRRAQLLEGDEAAEALQAAVKDGLAQERSEELWDQLIASHQQRGDHASAARTAELAASTTSDGEQRTRFYHNAGRIWREEAGDRGQAIRCFKQTINSTPQHQGALDALEALCSEVGDHETLVEILGLKVASSGKRPSLQKALLLRRGETLLELRRREEGIADLNKALSLDSEYVPALLTLARDAMKHHQPDRAEAFFRRLTTSLSRTSAKVAPEQRVSYLVEAHLQLAKLSQDKENNAVEEGHLEMALAVDPHNLKALERLDELFSEQRRIPELIEVVRRRCEVCRDHLALTELDLRLAELLESQPGHNEEAVVVYRRILQRQPDNTIALESLSKFLERAHRHSELADLLERRAELAEGVRAKELWVEAARIVQRRLADPVRAQAYLRRALTLAPEDPDLLDELLVLVGDEEQPVDLDPDLLHRTARLHREAGRHEEELRALRAALRGSPEGPDRARIARELLEVTERDNDALMALLLLLEEDPTSQELWQLAKLLDRMNERERAVEVVRRLPPEVQIEEEIRRLLWRDLEVLERFEELAEEKERHARHQSDPSARIDHLLEAARIWVEKVGDVERAERALVGVATLEPFALDALDRIGQLLSSLGASDRFNGVIQRLVRSDIHTPSMQAEILCHAARYRRVTGAPWQDVEQGYLEALDRDQSCIDALDGLIALFDERKDREQLSAWLLRRAEEGAEIEPRVDALLKASQILIENLRKPDQAIPLLRRASELRPEDPRVLSLTADLHLVLGELAQAEETLVALADRGQKPTQSLERAAGLARLRRDGRAEVRYLKLLAGLRPNDLQVAARLATACRAADDLEGECAALHQLAEVDSEALLKLVDLYAGPLEDLPSAYDTLGRYLEESSDHKVALERMVDLCDRLDRPAKTIYYLHRLHRLEPPGERRLAHSSRIARLEEALGNVEAAEETWRQALAEAPHEPALVMALVDNLVRQDKSDALCLLLEEILVSSQLPLDTKGQLATLLGMTYLDRLDDEQLGVQWLKTACSLSVDNEAAYQRLATLLRQRGEIAEVAELLAHRIKRIRGKDRPPLFEELGDLQEVHLKDLKTAAGSFAAAYREDPESRLDCALRAQRLYVKTDDLDSALSLLEQTIARVDDPTRGELEATRARILAIQGMVPESIEAYQRALKHDPALASAHAELGRQLFGLGRFDTAIPHLNKAAARLENPTDRASCSLLAKRAAKKLGLDEKELTIGVEEEAAAVAIADENVSETEFAETPNTKPLPTLATGARRATTTERIIDQPSLPPGVDVEEMGPLDWQRLADRYQGETAAASSPQGHADLLIKAARITEEQLSRPLEALGLYEKAANLAPEYIRAVEALADAAYRNQDWHRARDLYEQLTQGESLVPKGELYYRRAVIHEALGDDPSADSYYGQAVAIDPRHRPALEARARLALWRDDTEVATEALTGLIKLISINELDALAETREKLGELHLRAGNLKQAKEYLEASLELNPQRKKIMQTLITVYQHLGEFTTMVDLLERLNLLTSNPLVRASLLHYRAEILGTELGKEEAAIDCLLRAYDLAPQYPPTLWRLIDYYWERDDLASVAEMGAHLMAAMDLENEAPDLRHVRLAVSWLVARNDLSTAIRLLGFALSKDSLIEPALIDLGHSAVVSSHASSLAELIRRADPTSKLRDVAARLLEQDQPPPGIGDLLGALQKVEESLVEGTEELEELEETVETEETEET